MSFLWITLAFVLDVSLRVMMAPGNWQPDIVLVALLYVSLRNPLGEAYVMSFLFGLAWDIAFMDPLGMHAFLFLLATMLTHRVGSVLWAQYAISRFAIGLVMCMLVRFGEVIFWLSNLRYEVPIGLPQAYILCGAITTGIVFALVPWRTSPIQLSKPSPQVLFGE